MSISLDQIDEREFRRALLFRARQGDRDALALLRDEYGVIVHVGTALHERDNAAISSRP